MTAETKLPLATVHGLYHIAIKTENLAATRKFWTDIIGLREFPRPDFGYPGAWLGCTQPGGLAIIHVYAGGPALGPEGKSPAGTAAIDHVSLSCSGYRSYVSRFKAAGLDWREFIVPGPAQICRRFKLLRQGDVSEACLRLDEIRVESKPHRRATFP